MRDSNGKTLDRTDLVYGVGLFLLTLLSRIPFRSQMLYHWDSVNFAFAMQKLDIAAEQPHTPGYIAYVWLCRLVDLFFHDPQRTMVWISIVSSGLAVAAMYLLGQTMFDRRVGLVGALFLFSSPLLWFYGEIALPHVLDLFLITLSAALLYKAAQGRGSCLIAAAVSLAVAGGVRQQTPVFMGFLVLYAVVGYFRRRGWREGWPSFVLSGAVGAALCVGWFVPLMTSVGGFARYRQIMEEYTVRFQTTTSLFMGAGWFGLIRNLRKLGMYTLYAWAAPFLPIAVALPIWLGRRRLRSSWPKALFLFLWAGPSAFYYAIIHMGQQGLVFFYLPVLLLLSALALLSLLEGHSRNVLIAVVACLVLLNAGVFLLAPQNPLGEGSFKVLSWDTLRRNDAYLGRRIEIIREQFPPQTTAVVASNWRFVEWYLPEYRLLPFTLIAKWEAGEGSVRNEGRKIETLSAIDLGLALNGQGQAFVVLFDDELDRFNASPSDTMQLGIGSGQTLSYLVLQSQDLLYYGPDELALLQP